MKIYQDLLAGADFAEMAKAKSQDPGSAEKGGDLGWFGRGQMIPVFEETAFKTNPGQIAEPVLSNYGWHIIQTLDRRQGENGEEVLARHILLRIEPSETTLKQLKMDAFSLYQKAQEKGLQKAAQEMGYKVEESGVFQEKDSFIKGIGRDANLVSFASKILWAQFLIFTIHPTVMPIFVSYRIAFLFIILLLKMKKVEL